MRAHSTAELKRKLWGAFKVRGSLMERGVAKEIIDEFLSGENVRKWERQGAKDFARKRVRGRGQVDETLFKKLSTQMTGRGFSWDIVSDVMDLVKNGEIEGGEEGQE